MKFGMNIDQISHYNTVYMHLTFKCHNHDCDNNLDTSSLKIMTCQNSHNHLG